MTVKIAGSVPDWPDNGLEVVESTLIDSPGITHVVIGVVDCLRVTRDYDRDTVTPTVRFLQVEVVRDGDEPERLRELIRAQLDKRAGRARLPLEGVEGAGDTEGVEEE